MYGIPNLPTLFCQPNLPIVTLLEYPFQANVFKAPILASTSQGPPKFFCQNAWLTSFPEGEGVRSGTDHTVLYGVPTVLGRMAPTLAVQVCTCVHLHSPASLLS